MTTPLGSGVIPNVGGAPLGVDPGNYALLDEIGRGGMGVVYRARDRRLGRIVAVKFLHGDRAGQPEVLERFRREARAASALDNSHICTIYEMDEQAGQPFIAMEFVPGRTLREHVQAGSSLAVIARLVAQVAQALAAAHAAGIIHRDVKPGNVVVRPDGFAKVLDFGMARLVHIDGGVGGVLTMDATTAGTLVGTVAYMSPEQARCEPVGPASDVFSLGVVLYELAAGQHPFDRETPMATLAAILADEALPAAKLNPDMPGELDELLQRMLAKDPAARPTAADVERALAAWAERSTLGSAATTSTLARTHDAPTAADGPSDADRRTVGRERELASLQEALAAAVAGTGSFRCVAGEPGIGKTTLVDRLIRSLRGHDAVAVGRGRCSERLAGSEAYLPVLEAVESLLQGDPTGGTAHALRVLAPTWHAQLSTTGVAQATNDHAQSVSQERLKRELLMFLREVTRTRACILFLDDLHWADLSTVELIAYLGGHCAQLRLLVILTYRPSELVLARHPLLAVCQGLEARGVCSEIALPFLSDEEIGRYLDAEFRGHAFPADFAAFLLGKTSGNPLFLVDLLRYLRENGVIARDAAGKWALSRPAAEFQRELPQSVRSMVQRKIDELADADRRLLTAASVQGSEFEAAIVARALGQDAAEVEDRLAALARQHAVARQVGEVELPDQTLTTRHVFVHALYQNALFASLQPARKAALAAAVATAMKAAHASHPEPVTVQLAILLETARDFAAAAEHYFHASENARRLFAQREATSLAERGLDLMARIPDGPAKVTLELRLAMARGIALESAAGAGNEEVRKSFDRARKLSATVDDVWLRFQTLTGLFWFEAARGNFLGACHELSLELLSIAAANAEPAFWLQGHLSHAMFLLQAGRPIEAEGHFELARSYFDPARHARLSHQFGQNPGVMAWGFGAMNLALMGRSDEGVARAGEALRLSERMGDPNSVVFSHFFRLFVAAVRRDPALARADGSSYLEFARDTPFFRATCQAYLGYAEAGSERADDHIEALRSAIAAFRHAGGLVLVPTFCSMLAELLLKHGRIDEAVRHVEDGLAIALECGNPWFDPELLRLRALVTLYRRDPPDAVSAAFAESVDRARRQGAATFELRALVYMVRNRIPLSGGDARAALADLHARLRDTNDTPDVRDAAALLASR